MPDDVPDHRDRADGDLGASLRSLVPDLPQPADRLDRVRARVERRRRRRRVVAPALAAAATAAVLLVVQPLGAADRRADDTVAAPTAIDRLSESPWYLFGHSGDGGRTSAQDVPPSTLKFDASGTFSAEACNRKSGRVTVRADRLVFSDSLTTDMGCAGPSRSVERAVDRALAGSTAWSVSTSAAGSELTLTTGAQVLRYWRSPTPRGAGSGVAWPSCDVLAADEAQREAGGPPLVPELRVPGGFRPVAVVRCDQRYTDVPAQPATGAALVRLLVQQQTTDVAATAAVVDALRQPDAVTPKNRGCSTVGRPPTWLLLVDADRRYLRPRVPRAVCGGPLDSLTKALARTPFEVVSSRAYPTPAVTTTTDPAAEPAAAHCAHALGERAVVSSAFATTAGAVKAHRAGPSRSPAAVAWASVPDAQVAYWCELRAGGSYSVSAVTAGAGPVRFATSNVPLLGGPEGPALP